MNAKIKQKPGWRPNSWNYIWYHPVLNEILLLGEAPEPGLESLPYELYINEQMIIYDLYYIGEL